jgi:hypothetical protein
LHLEIQQQQLAVRHQGRLLAHPYPIIYSTCGRETYGLGKAQASRSPIEIDG